MAAYAAFKHVELYNVGKAKKRVLRPPGGGSSDIFGADMPATPRTVKNRMMSNIFSAEKDGAIKNNGDAPRRGQKSVDSHSRLFGEPSRPITPGKNHMKSSIPFGQNTEAAAAQKLLTNTNGHYNGKSGSVSSASSSVSSSTENLKINSGSRSVFRNMSTESESDFKMNGPDSAYHNSDANSGDLMHHAGDAASVDLSCKDNDNGSVADDSSSATESGRYGFSSKTRRTAGTNPLNPYSLDKMNSATAAFKEPLGPCADYIKDPQHVPCIKIHAQDGNRNPITGFGLNGDGVGGLKPLKNKIREGNPVTGEGYKPGQDPNPQPTMNGANQVINKNRVPPGGYSSGLW